MTHILQALPGSPGVVALLVLIILAQGVMIFMLVLRNIKLSDDNTDITRDAIKGFESIIGSLQAIRSDLQVGDNSISEHVRDMERLIKETHREVVAHLQYLRDKSR